MVLLAPAGTSTSVVTSPELVVRDFHSVTFRSEGVLGTPKMSIGNWHCLSYGFARARRYFNLCCYFAGTCGARLPLSYLLSHLRCYGVVGIVTQLSLHQYARTCQLRCNLQCRDNRVIHCHECDIVVDARCPAILFEVRTLGHILRQNAGMCANPNHQIVRSTPPDRARYVKVGRREA